MNKMKHFNTNYDTIDCCVTTNTQQLPPQPPPQLPVKMRPKLSSHSSCIHHQSNHNLNTTQLTNTSTTTTTRPPSQYDNIINETNTMFNQQYTSQQSSTIKYSHSNSCPHFSTTFSSFNTSFDKSFDNNCLLNVSGNGSNGRPPPLPPKKRIIMNYMEMVGRYNGPVDAEFYRLSMHTTYNMVQSQFQHTFDQTSIRDHNSFVSQTSSDDSLFSYESDHRTSFSSFDPPLLPPKKNKSRQSSSKLTDNNNSNNSIKIINTSPLSIHPRTSTPISFVSSSESGISSQSELTSSRTEPEELQIEPNPLDENEVSMYLIYKSENEDGPEIRGGTVDALIVKAADVSKNDFLFQEAFLTTFRCFINPIEVINKLLYRYNKFIFISDIKSQRCARNAFVLLVRVVDDMCIGDCNDVVLQNLMDFIDQLVNRGDLALAKILRLKVLEKMDQHQNVNTSSTNILLPSIGITLKLSSILDFKSEQLAEQMTVLDSKLFLKIEIPEVLVWAKEQKEELIPNLNTFTEHFNKMSYWTRSKILEHEKPKERERLLIKFIKIMKHLRKLNNFNSYLAILSALDSAPIRRLEWQKNITETLKEYSALIDSSSSFRAYRQALADSDPPCIPYIGLILQDLTFVHIGNNDFLQDGNINFAKCWQQYHILDQMRRFKNSHYSFKQNDQIISLFNNFDNYLSEEAMWQISEAIKPRIVTKK